MFPIIIFILGLLAVVHGISQISLDVFWAASLIVLGVAVMLVSLSTGLTISSRSNPSHSAAASRPPAKRG